MLRFGKQGQRFYDPEVKQRLLEMNACVAKQWKAKPPLRHPAIAMCFCLPTAKSDRDNKFTTVLDALVQGGVLKDDCVAHSNGVYVILRALISPTPVTTVWLEPGGDIGPLVAKVAEVDAMNQIPMKVRKPR